MWQLDILSNENCITLILEDNCIPAETRPKKYMKHFQLFLLILSSPTTFNARLLLVISLNSTKHRKNMGFISYPMTFWAGLLFVISPHSTKHRKNMDFKDSSMCTKLTAPNNIWYYWTFTRMWYFFNLPFHFYFLYFSLFQILISIYFLYFPLQNFNFSFFTWNERFFFLHLSLFFSFSPFLFIIIIHFFIFNFWFFLFISIFFSFAFYCFHPFLKHISWISVIFFSWNMTLYKFSPLEKV